MQPSPPVPSSSQEGRGGRDRTRGGRYENLVTVRTGMLHEVGAFIAPASDRKRIAPFAGGLTSPAQRSPEPAKYPQGACATRIPPEVAGALPSFRAFALFAHRCTDRPAGERPLAHRVHPQFGS
jgi:hypothetical protein